MEGRASWVAKRSRAVGRCYTPCCGSRAVQCPPWCAFAPPRRWGDLREGTWRDLDLGSIWIGRVEAATQDGLMATRWPVGADRLVRPAVVRRHKIFMGRAAGGCWLGPGPTPLAAWARAVSTLTLWPQGEASRNSRSASSAGSNVFRSRIARQASPAYSQPLQARGPLPSGASPAPSAAQIPPPVSPLSPLSVAPAAR